MLFPSWLILQVVNLNRLLASPDLTSCARQDDESFMGRLGFGCGVIYCAASVPRAQLWFLCSSLRASAGPDLCCLTEPCRAENR